MIGPRTWGLLLLAAACLLALLTTAYTTTPVQPVIPADSIQAPVPTCPAGLRLDPTTAACL